MPIEGLLGGGGLGSYGAAIKGVSIPIGGLLGSGFPYGGYWGDLGSHRGALGIWVPIEGLLGRVWGPIGGLLGASGLPWEAYWDSGSCRGAVGGL